MSAWRDPSKQQQDSTSSLMADYSNQPTTITTPIPSSSPSDSESADKNSASNIECVVCGDKSSGKHYGQYTCEGCKSFFKRSVRRNLTYQCRGNKNCPIDQHHRNQCQYCRLKKCLKNGMRKEAVQRGRIANQGMLSAQYPFVNCGVNGNFGYRESASQYINLLMRADTCVYPDLARYYGAYGGTNLTASGFNDTAAQILIQSITWCRSIPFFGDLPPNDRWNLVKHSWSDLFILTAAQQSSLGGQSLVSQTIAAHNLTSSSNASNYHVYQTCTLIQDRIDKLRSLHIDAVEYNCLKAIALYSTDAPQLSDPAYVEMLQEKSQCALEEYIRTKLEYGGPNSTRAGRLLLRLPSLRAISSTLLENVFFRSLIKPVNLDSLLRDLLLGSPSGSFGAWSAYGMTPALTAC